MPGALLHAQSAALCAHGGQVKFVGVMPRVKVMSQAVAVKLPGAVAGCTQAPPVGPPCATVQWITAAMRVKAMGNPVLLADSKAIGMPPGTPVTVIPAPGRVKGI
jgi:hypothetical protein